MAVSQSLSVTQSSQSVDDNNSKVRIRWTSTQTGESYNGYTRTAYYYVSVNGGSETRYSVSYTLPKASTKVIVDTTITVPHKTDGTGKVTVRTWMNTGLSAGEIEKSASLTLDTIPRATTPTLSASSVFMGDAVTIRTPRASSSFTHNLAYKFAGSDWKSIATGVGTSYNWTVPDLAASIPSAASGTVTIRCITYNGGASVGTKTVLLTAKVPTSVVPTISKVTVTEATSGIAEQFGAFIQNRSALAVSITAAGAKGSTIKSYSTTLDGGKYTGGSWTSDTLTGSGTLSLVTTVTDSRGRTAKKTTNISVLAYTPPKVSRFEVFRADADGTTNQDGLYLLLNYAYTVSSLGGKNTAQMEITYKRSTETEWSGAIYTSTSTASAAKAVVDDPTFSLDYQYDIRLTLKDWFGSESTYTQPLLSGAVIFDLLANGRGIAFGKTAEREGVDFGWQVKGLAMGLDEASELLLEGEDLNNCTEPGLYGIAANVIAETLKNAPTGSAGTMVVFNSTGRIMDASTTYFYIIQEYRPYKADEAIYRRRGTYNRTANTWSFSDWIGSTGGGMVASASVYGEATMNEEA